MATHSSGLQSMGSQSDTTEATRMSHLHVSLELSNERWKRVLLGKDFRDENVMNALRTARSLDRI